MNITCAKLDEPAAQKCKGATSQECIYLCTARACNNRLLEKLYQQM